ncbi:MAG: type II toxin-antitoxin system RelE/ParE family toxin [Gemmataceae bacterium]|nr:type II toxin-antitoxin system RelE/ParE family toxin [Gemmataceae bacterium]
MPYDVRISARALRDVDEILAWLDRHSPQAAARWHASLLAKVETLESQPEQWPMSKEVAQLGIELRQALFGKRQAVYRLLFTIDGNLVTVHAVRRGARDWLKPRDL